MVNRTAAGYAAYRLDLILSRQAGIDFLKRALVIADYYRWLVDVKQHIFVAGIQIAIAMLFQRQIDGRVGISLIVD